MTAHILVVEDSDSLRQWLAGLLLNNGYEVTQAASGEQALVLLRQTGEYRVPFDLVLADLVMGEVGGVEVTEAARNQPEPPEVMLLTSNGNLASATAAIRLGAFDYLLKPVRPPLLLERVAAAVARRAEWRLQAEEVAAWRAVAQVANRLQPSSVAAAMVSEAAKPDRLRVIGQLQVDTQRREIRVDGQLVAVTPIEYAILSVLSETPAVVVSYGVVAQRTHAARLSEREAYGLLRTHVHNLRHKIGRSYLVSIRGVGYMLDESGQATSDDDG